MKQISERQLKLNLLKKFKETDKFKTIEENVRGKIKAYEDTVLYTYVMTTEEWEEYTDKKLFNDKNRAVWELTIIKDFKDMLTTWEAETIIIEDLDNKTEKTENFIKKSFWTNMSTFRSPTDLEYTATDKHCALRSIWEWMIELVDVLIEQFGKEEKATDTPKTTEDNSNLE